MIQTLSKILTFLLALQFLFASTGVAVYYHYCNATAESRRQLLFEDQCCDEHHSPTEQASNSASCCQLPPQTTPLESDDCCTSNSEFLQLDFDSPAQQFLSFDLEANYLLVQNIVESYLPKLRASERISFYHDTSPPPLIEKRFQRFQNFRL